MLSDPLSIWHRLADGAGSEIWTAFFRDENGRQHCRSTQSTDRKLAQHVADQYEAGAQMLFKSARRDELIHDDPALFVESVRRSHPSQKRRAFTVPEISAVLNVADPEWRSMVFFGLYTGQRLGDIASLCWNNLDLEQGQVRFVTAKTGRSMILPLAPALSKHVLSLPTSDNPEAALHPRAYKIVQLQGRTGSLSNQFSDLLAQAGLREKKTHHKTKDGRSVRRASEGLSFHSLRHTTTSLLHAAGIPPAVAQAFVGHDSESIHAFYTHVGSASLQTAANVLPESL
jgi:integrase